MPEHSPYLVLARKYRPALLADLKGQEALVQTLGNAIKTKRIAHAFLLTGIRGIGKTTTARIIARALNCIGADGKGEATITPCGVCQHCTAILQDRHTDVLEMDAASRTGVNDIRELIENAHYLPASARYKIYIIDEVHMLSNSAFNALLKTLEEPPAHVKFIFATTEIRKIPVTILSRCQRFDLRRLSVEELAAHLQEIAAKEGFSAEDEALSMLAGAAEGSVRDGLSLLDQAIAHTYETTGKAITAATIRTMLGTGEKTFMFDLFEQLASGNSEAALAQFSALYQSGTDPFLALNDLLEICHLLTRFKATPALAEGLALPEISRLRSKKLAEQLSIGSLTRLWQMLLKGLQEVQSAPNARMAAEMVLIRIAFSANLPTPARVIQDIQSGKLADGMVEEIKKKPDTLANKEKAAGFHSPLEGESARRSRDGGGPSPVEGDAGGPLTSHQISPHQISSLDDLKFDSPSRGEYPTALLPEPLMDSTARNVESEHRESTVITSFHALTELFQKNNEPLLYHQLRGDVHLVDFEEGKLTLRLTPNLPKDFTTRIGALLNQWTNRHWTITATQESGQETIETLAKQHTNKRQEEILHHPHVKQALETFPGARVKEVRLAEEV